MMISGFDKLGAFQSVETSRGATAERQFERLASGTAMTTEEKQIMNAAKEFESYFIYMLMKEMRKTIPKTGLMDGGRAEEVFTDMLDEEMGRNMAKESVGGIGIAKMIYDQLSRTLLPSTVNSTPTVAAMNAEDAEPAKE